MNKKKLITDLERLFFLPQEDRYKQMLYVIGKFLLILGFSDIADVIGRLIKKTEQDKQHDRENSQSNRELQSVSA